MADQKQETSKKLTLETLEKMIIHREPAAGRRVPCNKEWVFIKVEGVDKAPAHGRRALVPKVKKQEGNEGTNKTEVSGCAEATNAAVDYVLQKTAGLLGRTYRTGTSRGIHVSSAPAPPLPLRSHLHPKTAVPSRAAARPVDTQKGKKGSSSGQKRALQVLDRHTQTQLERRDQESQRQ